METHPGNKEELYLLMVLSASGGMILVTANHFAGLFVGMEILSIPLYGLAAYSFQRSQSLESGIKYLILSAIATAFLLFGMALLYADTGHLTYTGIQQVLATHSENSMLIWAGVAMMLVAFAFKLSLIPFHLWTPDVYEGAPVPITAFLATVSKIAAVAALLRLLHTIPALNTVGVQTIFAIMASVSIIGGNLLALMQSNLKRLLGFSSIAHFGYLFIAFVVNQQLQSSAIAVYLLAYTITTLAAFGVLTYISSPYQGKDIENITDYQGLFWQQPYLVTVLSIALLSLAGIPLTIGFIGKFYVMMLGVNAALWWLMATLAIGTVLGMYYYLRVLITMFRMEEITLINSNTVSFSYTASNIMLITTGILMLILGAYPQPMLQMALIAMGMN
jgi:NADH-quinone oxidoreductase subunit N